MAAPAERTTPVPVWVLGARGLLAGELLRLLEAHPFLRLAGAFSREPVALRSAHPHLVTDLETTPTAEAPAVLAAALDREAGPVALVLALPHGQAAAVWRALRQELGERAERVRVVDLSADYRLADPDAYARWYGGAHPDPEELPRFAYGLPEHGREALAGGRRTAAPGCFATAMQLAVVPAARAGLLDAERPWSLFAVTGSSGSGNEPKAGTHHPHRHGNLWAYALGGHRHEAELEQALARADLAPPLHFVPHSGPFTRGIHLTAHLPLAGPLEADAARALYAEVYAGEPFVEVLPEGVPDLRRVVGSNRASLALHTRGEVLNVVLTLDNTLKGGAGQALQGLNLMLGFREDAGLSATGLGVV